MPQGVGDLRLLLEVGFLRPRLEGREVRHLCAVAPEDSSVESWGEEVWRPVWQPGAPGSGVRLQ